LLSLLHRTAKCLGFIRVYATAMLDLMGRVRVKTFFYSIAKEWQACLPGEIAVGVIGLLLVFVSYISLLRRNR
jgi:hypothetical protein